MATAPVRVMMTIHLRWEFYDFFSVQVDEGCGGGEVDEGSGSGGVDDGGGGGGWLLRV